MFLLTGLDDGIALRVILVFIVILPFVFAFVYFSIKLFYNKRVIDKILGIIGILSSIVCLFGVIILLLYNTFGDYYTFSRAEVLNVDKDKVHVRYKNDFYSNEYTYESIDRPFYVFALKENDYVYVRLHNGSNPKLFLFRVNDKFSAMVYAVGLMSGIGIVIYYFVEKGKFKKEERKKMGYEEES
jgi:hypothetical protein